MNKRGEENLMWKQILTLVITFIVFAAVIIFLSEKASGELVKREIFAKQLCTIITGAEPETVINITTKVIIEKQDKGISIKKNSIDFGYYYPCANTNFEVYKENENTIIKINKYKNE